VSRPLRVEYPGAFYHVTSRGNERKMVFQSTRDREKYLSYLESAHDRYKSPRGQVSTINKGRHSLISHGRISQSRE
jgi:REP element-mobilizing transposase RayT